jgi:hypothetical protein
MNEMVERVARAMRKRAALPVANLESLEPVLVGSLGDAWFYLARAAIEAMGVEHPNSTGMDIDTSPTVEIILNTVGEISHVDKLSLRARLQKIIDEHADAVRERYGRAVAEKMNEIVKLLNDGIYID